MTRLQTKPWTGQKGRHRQARHITVAAVQSFGLTKVIAFVSTRGSYWCMVCLIFIIINCVKFWLDLAYVILFFRIWFKRLSLALSRSLSHSPLQIQGKLTEITTPSTCMVPAATINVMPSSSENLSSDIVDAEKSQIVPLFPLDSIVFPYEVVTLDCRTGSMISLAAALTRDEHGDLGSSKAFCIAESFQSRVGTIARLDPERIPRWIGSCVRITAFCTYRCWILGEDQEDRSSQNSSTNQWPGCRSYRLLRVMPFPDEPPLRISAAVQDVFPFSCPTTRDDVSPSGVQTRSTLRTVPKRLRRHSSFICIEYRTYRAFQESYALKRLRRLAFGTQSLTDTASAKNNPQFDIDENLMEAVPSDRDTPAKWSFWFSAAMRLSEVEKRKLLAEPIPVLRLRFLIDKFANHHAYSPGREFCKRQKRSLLSTGSRAPTAKHNSKRRKSSSCSASQIFGNLDSTCKTLRQIRPWPVFNIVSFSGRHST